MDIAQKMLTAYVERIASKPSTLNGFPSRMMACVLLDNVAADQADTASPKECAEIFRLHDEVKKAVLHPERRLCNRPHSD